MSPAVTTLSVRDAMNMAVYSLEDLADQVASSYPAPIDAWVRGSMRVIAQIMKAPFRDTPSAIPQPLDELIDKYILYGPAPEGPYTVEQIHFVVSQVKYLAGRL